jgi:Helix-turn-helix domain
MKKVDSVESRNGSGARDLAEVEGSGREEADGAANLFIGIGLHSPGLTLGELAVYWNLKSRASSKGSAWPSIATIAKDMGMSKRSVDKAIAGLIRKKFISKEGGKNRRKQQKVNRYEILPFPNIDSEIIKKWRKPCANSAHGSKNVSACAKSAHKHELISLEHERRNNNNAHARGTKRATDGGSFSNKEEEVSSGREDGREEKQPTHSSLEEKAEPHTPTPRPAIGGAPATLSELMEYAKSKGGDERLVEQIVRNQWDLGWTFGSGPWIDADEGSVLSWKGWLKGAIKKVEGKTFTYSGMSEDFIQKCTHQARGHAGEFGECEECEEIVRPIFYSLEN